MPDDAAAESGSTLREKLEASIERNKSLAEELKSYRAKDLVSTKGWALVKPDDFKGVELEKLEEHGQSLHEQRVGLIRDLFSSQGLEGDDLDSQVSAFLAGKRTESAGDPAELDGADRARALSHISGTPPTATQPEVHGVDALRAHFIAQEKKKP